MFGWFKKKQETAEVPAPNAAVEIQYVSLQDELATVMRGHGLDANVYQDWLLVANDLPLLRGTYNVDRYYDDQVTVEIDIELRLSADRSIYEHYAGVEADARQAIGQGLFKFCCGTFHVFLSAYWDHHEPDQVDVQRWIIDGTPWDAYIGNMINNTSEGQAADIPRGYLSTAHEAICALTLTPEDHWLSFYAANLKGELTSEARWDNDVWPELGQTIAELGWIPAEGFYSTRNFILLRPVRAL
jgi:hypothetical protein